MLRLALFDIDGTLIRTGGAGVKAFAKVFSSEFGVSNGFERLKFAGRTDYSLVREFFVQHSIAPTPANFRRFFDAYVFWLDQLLSQCEGGICPGVLEFIAGLRGLNPRPLIGLLTGNIRLGAEIKLRYYGLWDLFETGAFADDHEERDCIAAIARSRGGTLLKQELPGHSVLVVGDTPHDIRCGRSIGARTLAVATGGSSLDELQPHRPDWLVTDLSRVSVSDVVGIA